MVEETVGLFMHFLMKFICKLLLLVTFLFPIGVYLFQFHNGLSDDYQVWSSFGDYIGGVYSVVMSIFMFYLAYKVEKMNEKKNERKKALKDLFNYVIDLCKNTNLDKANEFQLCVDKNQLFIAQADYNKLMEFYDYCLEVTRNDQNKDVDREKGMKDYIIDLYNRE